MTPYLTSADGMKLTFGNLPENLQPKQGDVLVCYDFNRFEGGFGGKVKSVSSVGNSYVVECDSLSDFSDIFHQFITVEEYKEQDNGQVVFRRAAGQPHRAEGDINQSIFNFTASPHLGYTGDNINFTLDLNVGFGASLKAAWNLSLWGKKQFKLEFIKTFSASAGITFSGKLETEKVWDNDNLLPPFYIPAAAPIFEVEWVRR